MSEHIRKWALRDIWNLTMSKSPMMDDICRECITCDGGCGLTNPSNKCARCHLTYYCSKKCQRKHWKEEHREDCEDVNGMRRRAFPTCTIPLEGTKTDCAICFRETIVDPLVLDCRHAFCFSCLSEYQERTSKYDKQIYCPLCRNPNAQGAPIAHVLLLATRADKKEPGEEREHLFQEAMDLLPKAILGSDATCLVAYSFAEILLLKGDLRQAMTVLCSLIDANKRGEENASVIAAKLDRCRELKLAGREDEAKQLFLEVEGNECPSHRRTREIEIQFLLAQAHEAQLNWDAALDVYKGMVVILSDGPPEEVQLRKVFMGISRGFYETGEYDKAISAGETAIEMNRHFPGVHKYVALSHKQKGNLEEAHAVMNRAVLYETPWDDSNRQQNYDLWKELVASADS